MCPDIENIASLLLDHEPVAEPAQQQFAAHLQECSTCRKEYQEWQTITGHLRRTFAGQAQQHPETAKLLLFSDNKTNGFERLLIQDHVSHCPACREELALLEHLDSMSRSFTIDTGMSGRWARIVRAWFHNLTNAVAMALRRPLGFAAAVLAVVLALGVFSLLERYRPVIPSVTPSAPALQNYPQPIPRTQAETPAGATKPQARPAVDRFKVLPHLEEMLGVTMRSEALRILSPPQDTLRSQQIEFRWQGDAGGLWLKIIDNQERLVFRAGPVQEAYRYRSTLPAGVYYWLLENEEEILWVGKFYIGRQEPARVP